MSGLIKLIVFFITAGVMPALTGLLPAGLLPAVKRRVPVILMSGYLATFALFEGIGLPVLLLTPFGDFRLLTILFTAADLAVIAGGLILCGKTGGIRLPGTVPETGARLSAAGSRNGKGSGAGKRRRMPDGEAAGLWIIFAALLGFELYKAYTVASYDGDDAYYVAQSLQTWTTGTMYHYVPYTGYSTPLDGRHALAMIPMWIAWIARLSSTHPTIVTHSMLPLLLIPAADLCCYNAAVQLSEGEPEYRRREMLPAFMIILAVLQIFGNVSIYTPQTFLLMRTWQGKTVFANLILPSAVALLLRLLRGKREDTAFCWILLVILNIASGFCTSLAPVMLTGLLMAAALGAAIVLKKWKLLPQMLLACVPNLLYLALLWQTIRSVGGR